MTFEVTGIPEAMAHEVRTTLRSPEYGHPALREVARGTGPCRSCLRLFVVGQEERLLFTWRPASRNGTLGAPGPVFIHAEPCARYAAGAFPPELTALPLMLEGRASGNRIVAAHAVTGAAIGDVIDDLLANDEVEFIDVRHGEAGCHITRIERATQEPPG